VAGFTAFRNPIKRRNQLKRINKGIAINFADIIFCGGNHQFKKYEDTLPSIWATKNLVGIVIFWYCLII
jgi:hypothetical protein